MLQRNGVILYYIVYYRADGESSFSSVAVPVTDQDASVTYTLSGLNPNTAYTIQVSGNNSAGEGPRTQSVNLTTGKYTAIVQSVFINFDAIEYEYNPMFYH